jgi:hypothetical protein
VVDVGDLADVQQAVDPPRRRDRRPVVERVAVEQPPRRGEQDGRHAEPGERRVEHGVVEELGGVLGDGVGVHAGPQHRRLARQVGVDVGLDGRGPGRPEGGVTAPEVAVGLDVGKGQVQPRQRRTERGLHGLGRGHARRRAQRQAAVHEQQRADELGVAGCHEHGDEGAHRVPDQHHRTAPTATNVCDHRGDVGGVPGQPPGSGQISAQAPPAQVGGVQPYGGQQVGDRAPAGAVGGDAVDRDDRRAVGRARGLDVQVIGAAHWAVHPPSMA